MSFARPHTAAGSASVAAVRASSSLTRRRSDPTTSAARSPSLFSFFVSPSFFGPPDSSAVTSMARASGATRPTAAA